MKKPVRERIFNLVVKAKDGEAVRNTYDFFMIVTIVVSLIPLAFKEYLPVFLIIDRATAVIFILDYVLRWVTADYSFSNKSLKAFIRYPFTPWAIVDLLSIIPLLIPYNDTIRVFRVARMLRTAMVFRIFKVLRYSKNFFIITRVLISAKESLFVVCGFAVGYILLSAFVVFNVEPNTFDTFFDAVYWATVSLTTVGYGDIYPVTTFGRIVTMFSSFFGVAVVALPAGIITARYMEEIKNFGDMEMIRDGEDVEVTGDDEDVEAE